MTDNLNVPADLTVTPDLRSTAASFMVLAASVVGPPPRDADGRRSYGYRLANEAAALAAAFSRPMDGLSHFLAQQRAAGEKIPAKGILRAVELVDVGTPRNGQRQSQKVKLTVESTANPTQYTKPGDVQEFLSDFTNAIGFGDFEARARSLIGQECLFRKYLEDTEGRSAKGSTATVVVAVTPLNAPANGNGQARAVQPERAAAPQTPRSPGSVTRPADRNPQPSADGEVTYPSREAVAAAAKAAEDATSARAGGEVAGGGGVAERTAQTWRDEGWEGGQDEHDKARARLTESIAAAPEAVKARLRAWVTNQGYVWAQPWNADQHYCTVAKLAAMIVEDEQARQPVGVGGGAEPASEYPYGDQPF